jgi:zinc/manganese transport system substrate-binding protein
LFSVGAQADLRVFACEAEWQSLAEAIGGEHVTTSSATTALQDPHYIQARPSLISQLRRADLLICTGADLEVGWLPQLLSKANNTQVRPGNPGWFEASSFVRRLDVPTTLDRAKGDVHPQGNPHVQANPHNLSVIAAALVDAMARLDPDNADAYRKRGADFLSRWHTATAAWELKAEPLRGKRVIPHHRSWVYLQDWLGLIEVATLEPLPGVPPSASHLGQLLSLVGTDGSGADLIIRAPYQPDKPSKWLSERTGIPAVMLPLSPGGSERAGDLFGMFDDILDRLLEATK